MKLTDFLDALPANAGHGLGASIRGLGAFGGFDSHRRPSRKSQWAMHMHSVTQAHTHTHIRACTRTCTHIMLGLSKLRALGDPGSVSVRLV